MNVVPVQMMAVATAAMFLPVAPSLSLRSFADARTPIFSQSCCRLFVYPYTLRVVCVEYVRKSENRTSSDLTTNQPARLEALVNGRTDDELPEEIFQSTPDKQARIRFQTQKAKTQRTDCPSR